jgi:Holliday junction resolvasome RuvABC endonuclease subunit
VNLAYVVLELSPTRSRAVAYGTLGEGLPEKPRNKLDELAIRIDRVMNTHCPDVVGYEDQAGVEVAKQRAKERNDPRMVVTFSSHQLHEVVGMLRFAARCSLDTPLPCYTPQPRSIKVALLGKGHGNAEKKSVQWGVERLLGVRGSSHVADALATAICTARMHRVLSARDRATAAVIR